MDKQSKPTRKSYVVGQPYQDIMWTFRICVSDETLADFIENLECVEEVEHLGGAWRYVRINPLYDATESYNYILGELEREVSFRSTWQSSVDDLPIE